MVRAASDSDSEVGVAKKSVNKASKEVEDAEEVAEKPEGEEEGEEDDEPEYEIEAILDAKIGAFGSGKLGYFVKWKGFPDEENSWVNEADAENAKDLITEYWAKRPKKTGRKSDIKPKAKGSRKSAADESSEAEATPPPTKKRGRGRPSKSAREDSDDEEEEEEKTTKKKGRKSNGAAPSKKAKTTSPAASDNESSPPNALRPSTIKKYKDIASWEDLVVRIDTVEKSADDTLLVYFAIKGNDKPCRETSGLAAEKFPKKLIEFYESNLRWKASESEEMEEGE
ncbi:hypothetical protein BV25DRAFT_1823570 [Artomyces pyxidatus]|uniref:Uncharacterized protein n=1 Tax=Artomyces pyxidatus TaxID=48021 RepID=A0ACB8T7X2_9AGAM|nr:hypothetical protein BV25DRAFT_1823570 [Artomyces pyxidatus]